MNWPQTLSLLFKVSKPQTICTRRQPMLARHFLRFRSHGRAENTTPLPLVDVISGILLSRQPTLGRVSIVPDPLFVPFRTHLSPIDSLYPTSLRRVTSTKLPRKRTYPRKRKRKRTRSRIHACVRAHVHALAHPSSRTPTWTTSSSSPTSSATQRTTNSLLTLTVPSTPSGTGRVSRPSSASSHERISVGRRRHYQLCYPG